MSYPSIFHIGHGALKDLFSGPVIIEEKIDGSQLTFGVYNGVLEMRSSSGKLINYLDNTGLFKEAAETVLRIQGLLMDGWTYCGEYLKKPKQNTLSYDRIPRSHIALFDVCTGIEQYLCPRQKAEVADALGLECVPLLFMGVFDPEKLSGFLDGMSFLGGQKVEGVVIKPMDYDLFGRDRKVVMGKLVSEAFIELNDLNWNSGRMKDLNQNDILRSLGDSLRTPARFSKVVQHLRESGELKGVLQDIYLISRDVPIDIRKECEEYIKDRLFGWAWPQLERMVVKGIPEWYKDELVVEKTDGGWSGYILDLPGCISTGGTSEECFMNLAEAFYFHIEGVRNGAK